MIRHADARKLLRGLLTFGVLVSIFISIPVCGQVAGGTITGTVSDTSGAVIPKAELSIKNLATGVATSATTKADGLYTVPNSLPGSYEVTTACTCPSKRTIWTLCYRC